MTSNIFKFGASPSQEKPSPRATPAFAAPKSKQRSSDVQTTLQHPNELELTSLEAWMFTTDLSDGKNLRKKTLAGRLQEQEMVWRQRLLPLLTARYI